MDGNRTISNKKNTVCVILIWRNSCNDRNACDVTNTISETFKALNSVLSQGYCYLCNDIIVAV